MRFLHGLIMSSRSDQQVKYFFPWFLETPQQIKTIREIGKNRRRSWLAKQTVPIHVLWVSRDIGIILLNEDPQEGINILKYTEHLYNFIVSGVGDDDKVELAKEIRKNTLEYEIFPRVKKCKIKNNKFLYIVK
jgi:flagellar biosynthesis regulator FlaF